MLLVSSVANTVWLFISLQLHSSFAWYIEIVSCPGSWPLLYFPENFSTQQPEIFLNVSHVSSLFKTPSASPISRWRSLTGCSPTYLADLILNQPSHPSNPTHLALLGPRPPCSFSTRAFPALPRKLLAWGFAWLALCYLPRFQLRFISPPQRSFPRPFSLKHSSLFTPTTQVLSDIMLVSSQHLLQNEVILTIF